MQMLEQISKFERFFLKESLCKKDKPEPEGQCRIGNKNDPGDLGCPNAKRLRRNMKNAAKKGLDVNIPSKPKKKLGSWNIDQCSPECFPSQTHHLIPKKHLPKHDVCVWLAKKKENTHWKLIASTNYDTDDYRNGLILPFASTAYQWRQAKNTSEQDEACETMMKNTKKQLHQGSHTYTDYIEKDDGEEDDLHKKEDTGYLGAVDQLLKVVNGQTLNHVWFCNDCNKSTRSRPYEVRPLERVVLSMHQVSKIIELMINGNKIFVSKRAANYFGK